MATDTLALLLIMAQAAPGTASPPDSGAHLQAAVVMTVQPPGISNHRVRPPLEGRAPGIAVGLGYGFDRDLAVEAEFVYAGAISAPQGFYYTWTEEYTAESRDLLFNGLLRVRSAALGPVEIVLGGGRALSRLRTHSGIRTELMPTIPPRQMIEQVSTHSALTATIGAEARLPAGRSLRIVPSVRWRWIGRDERNQYLGVSGRALQIGIGIRAGL